MSKQVGIYVRLSEVRPGEEAVSLATQEADARALCNRKGWKVAKVYRESGRSAWKDNRDRPEFNRMLGDLEDGAIEAICAFKQDRLGRRVAEVAALLDRCRQLGAQVVCVADGLDTSTASGRMAAQVIAASAELESANTSIRVSRAIEVRAERGDPHGGPRPYGYRREGGTLIIEPAEAAIVRECVDRVLGGEHVSTLIRDLRARGVTTSGGAVWRRRSLVMTLTSARIAGLRSHLGAEVEGTWEPIITPDELEGVRAALEPSPVRRSAPRSYALSGGLLKCGRCGAALKGRSWIAPDGRPARRSQYACSGAMDHVGCGGLAVTAEPLDDWVAALVISKLANKRFRARLESLADDPGTADLHRRARKLDVVADDLASAFGAGELDRRAFKIATERNDTERAAIASELRARAGAQRSILVGAPSTEAALLKWWDAAAVHERHALVAAVIESIEVGPAVRGRRTFDPDRLAVAWRD